MPSLPNATLSDLQAFAAVARARSFRRAAAELAVSPSALSHALRSLETRLGVRLLHRTTRSVAPTPAGERLLAQLTPALRDIAEALDAVNDYRESPVGTLRLNAPRAACDWVLGPLVLRFLASHPGMRIDLVDDDRIVDIVADGFDAGVRFGELLAKDMVAVPLGPPQRFVVVASPDYLARRGAPTDPRALVAHDCIRIRFAGGTYYRWQFSRDGDRVEVDVDGPLALHDMRQMVAAAAHGLGLAYVYAQYAQDGIASGRLVTVLDDWRPEETGFFLYYPSHRLPPAGLRAFIELARTTFPSNRPPSAGHAPLPPARSQRVR